MPTSSPTSFPHGPLCNHTIVECVPTLIPTSHPTTPSCLQASSTKSSAIKLPAIVMDLLANPSAHAIPANITSRTSLLVADSGSTDHMIPELAAFISYKPIQNLRVGRGNNTIDHVLGPGTTIFSLNAQCILVCDVLHVPALPKYLYSLLPHMLQ